MTEPIDLYITVVVLGTILTVLVGVLLYRNGEPFLGEVFDDPEKAVSVNRLLMVLYHLVMLGMLALLAGLDIPWADGPLQLVMTKLGVVLLVLGIAHGIIMLRFSQLRSRRKPLPVSEVTVQPATSPGAPG